MTIDENKLCDQLKEVAIKHSLKIFLKSDFEGGRNWLNYRQIDEDKYRVRISTREDIDVYKSIKEDVKSVFAEYNVELYSESNYKSRSTGFQEELIFMDSQKMQEMKDIEQAKNRENVTFTQINGVSYGSINTGSAEQIDNSSENSSDDKKWFQKEIVKMFLSFVAGVGITLFTQWILHILGW